MNKDLGELKNLGNTSVNWLHAIGIHNFDDLQRIGPAEAYAKIKVRGFRVSKVLLYALQGALINIHWNDLDANLKALLLSEAANKMQQIENFDEGFELLP